MGWRLGDEPKKWSMDKGKPILINDYTAIANTTRTTGLSQQYKKQDVKAEEERMHKIRQSEMDSFNEGVMPYGLDNPVAPLTSETQMPYSIPEVVMQAGLPAIGFGITKKAFKHSKKYFSEGWDKPIQNTKKDVINIWDNFNKGIDEQIQWMQSSETKKRSRNAYKDFQYSKGYSKGSKGFQEHLLDEKILGQRQGMIPEVSTSTGVDSRILAYYQHGIPGTNRNEQIVLNLNRAYETPSHEIRSAGRHEMSHASNFGGDLYNEQTLNRFSEEIVSLWESNLWKKATPTNRKELVEQYDYLSTPTEIHARIEELRGIGGFKPGNLVTETDINVLLYMPTNSGAEIPLTQLLSVLKGKKSIVKLMNYLPALAPVVPVMKPTLENYNNENMDKWKVQ